MPPMPWALLAAGCFAMFAASSSGTTRAPFLLDMARDLASSLPMVANLMAATSISWGIASILAGAGSDRWGRRPFLVLGPPGLAASLVGVAMAEGYWAVAFWVTAGGFCAGGFTGVIMAEASARTVDRQRGRALGWIMAGQSVTLLVGVPMAAWVGAHVGWRGVHLATAGLALLAGLFLFLATLRPAGDGGGGGGARPSLAGAMSGPVLRLLSMGVAERVCYGLTAVYYATFLQATHGLSAAGVALPLLVFALGHILGTVIGGQLADRLPDRRRTFGVTMLVSAATALLLFGWAPSLHATVGAGFLYALVIAVARPCLMAALAEVPDHVRGTVLGLNVTSASVGWLAAAALGGAVVAAFGFAGFGPFAAAFALIGAMLAWRR